MYSARTLRFLRSVRKQTVFARNDLKKVLAAKRKSRLEAGFSSSIAQAQSALMCAVRRALWREALFLWIKPRLL